MADIEMSEGEVHWQEAPNWGRNDPEGLQRPEIHSMEYRFADPDDLRTIYLCIEHNPDIPERELKWALQWELYDERNPNPKDNSTGMSEKIWVYRTMELRHEVHTWDTYWGPKTAVASERITDNLHGRIPIARLSLEARTTLEKCALQTRVWLPNPLWNNQNWIWDILRAGVRAGILTEKELRRIPHRPYVGPERW